MKTLLNRNILAVISLLILPILSWGQGAVVFDGSFNASYLNFLASRNPLDAIEVQADDKIIVRGNFQFSNGNNHYNGVARLNSDGSTDFSYRPTSTPGITINGVIYCSAQQGGGKIIGGNFTASDRGSGTARNFARVTLHPYSFNGYWNIDQSFFNAVQPNEVRFVSVQPDDKIFVSGDFTYYPRLIRLLNNGFPDGTFNSGTGPNGIVNSMLYLPDGKIIIGGSFTTYNGTARNGFAKLNPDGSLDSTFIPINIEGINQCQTAIQPDGKIIIAGSFTVNNSTFINSIARLNSDGSLDNTFSIPSCTHINNIAVQSDGRIILLAWFDDGNNLFTQRIVRIFGCSTPSTPTISGNNTICVGGSTILTSSSATGNIWSTGDTTQSITVNSAGSYSVWRVLGACTSEASRPIAVSTIICNQIFTGDGLFTNTDRWLGGSLPNTGTDITVRGRMTLTSSVSLRNVNIENGGIVVPSGLTLTVTGNLSNQGVISGSGNVRLAGSNNQEFGGGAIANLLVDNSATAVQASPTQISGSLTLGNNQVLNLNNLSLTLLSTATHTAQLAQVPSSSSITNASNFTVQRWLNRNVTRRGVLSNGNYHFLGPVVQGQTMNLWNSVSRYNNQTFSGSGVGNLYLYNPTANNWYKPSSPATALPVGAGVQVWFGSTTFFASRNEWSATGAPQVGDYNLPITAERGFHLLSNPYPSTIDWDSPNWTKTNVANAIYIYDWVSRRYKSYIDGVGANGGNRYLPTAQGFLVNAENNSPVLTAREGIKVSNQVALQRTESQVSSLVRMQVRRGTMTDEVVIAHRPNTQLAFEPQVDAKKIMNPATNIFVGGAVSQSIASMDLNAATIIPIELLSDSSGNVTLSTTEFSGLSGGPYYLVDEITTEVYPYTPQTNYQFYLNANERYSLSLRLNNVNGVNNFKATQFEVFPNPATNKVTVNTTGTGTLEIVNTLGQVVITQPAVGTNEINISKLAMGVYTVRFNGSSKMLVVK